MRISTWNLLAPEFTRIERGNLGRSVAVTLRSGKGLPSEAHPSDHVPLSAHLAWTAPTAR